MEGTAMSCSICGKGEYITFYNESGSMSYTEPTSHLDCVETLDRMLRLAWEDTAMLNRVHGYDEQLEEFWLADLKARAEEGSG